jgi:hypothetical protein
MRREKYFATLIAALIISACTTPHSVTAEDHAKKTVLFEDSLAEDWQANWFLDGLNATVEHRDGGLAVLTEASKVDKRVDRAAFDAQHAVLWTRESFEGDIRITYKITDTETGEAVVNH